MLQTTLSTAFAADPKRGPARSRVPGSRRQRPHTRTTRTTTAGLGPAFEYARDAMVVGDILSGSIVDWNPAAERLFGYPASEAVGKPVDMLMPPAAARFHRECLGHYARTGDATILSPRESRRTPALTSRGDEIPTELSIAPLDTRVSDHSTRQVLLMFRDATENQQSALHDLQAARAESARAESEARKLEAEALLRHMTGELESCIARVQRAAARLARMASRAGAPPERLARMANVVEARSDALRRFIGQIDDMASIQSGSFQLRAERINLVPLIGRLVAAIRARSTAHRLHLAAPQGLTTTGDSRRLEQVVQTLIDRAIRRSPRGCWIDVDMMRPLAGLAQIEVRDYGRPLSDAGRERVVADREWAVCRYIVERHGGRLWVEFPAEGGVRAIFTLPTNPGRSLR